MVYNIQNYSVLGLLHCPIFYKTEKTTFRKDIHFPKRRVFYFLEYRTMEKSKNPVIL
jgi:hypothetical protein